ncbi:MAG: extracellular solute-binding protein [Clostridia bacterium]|nr:extracellular solute-binding protein [Clostridia bacterium]
MKLRTISLLLVLILFLPLLAACSESKENTEETAPPSATTDPTAATETEEETESLTPHWDAVGKPDLGGISINALSDNFTSNYYNVLDWDEITGEGLADAMYNRNRLMEATLNCTLAIEYNGSPANRLIQSVTAGTGDVDLCYELMTQAGGLITRGFLMPFNKLETADMTQPYWDQGAQKQLAILGQVYHGYLDFGFDHYDSMTVLFYNGVIFANYQLEDPLELFDNEEWTVAKMLEQIEAVSTDLNADGKFTLTQDMYGLVGREYQYQPIGYASGVSLISWDSEEKTFTLNLADERFITVSEAISSIYNVTNKDMVNYSDYDAGRRAFSDGRALYYSRLLGDFRQLREVEDDYGVIAFPRYSYEDGSDSSYFVQNPTTLYLPISVGDDNRDGEMDFDEIGLFLQAVGAYTYDETLDVYINSAVIGKGMRDQKSAEMVRLMMTNRSFDIGQSFSFPSILESYKMCIQSNGKYASTAKKIESAFKKAASKTMKEIENNLD